MVDLAQLVAAGLTVGAVYALVALGFTLVFNASEVVNFAQGEFVMLGGMVTVMGAAAGLPLPAAALLAVASAVAVGLLLERACLGPVQDAPPVVLIIVTIGASILIRGLAQVAFGKEFHHLPAVAGDVPWRIGGVAVLPQSVVVLAAAAAIVVLLQLVLGRTLLGKALRATAANRLAARLVGIDVRVITAVAMAASAAIGALAGILITPITLTSYDAGTLLALKGFAAAVLGGMGSPAGAVLGGLAIGLLEALTAGYLSSTYKDATAFLVILLVLLMLPQGLLGRRSVERV